MSFESEMGSLIDDVVNEYGRVDVLVNNARSNIRQNLGEEDFTSWDVELRVNLMSAYFLGKFAIQNGCSRIVNVGSVTSEFVSHESAAYQISKGGFPQMTRVLAALGRGKCTVNCVSPGAIIKETTKLTKAQEKELRSFHFTPNLGTAQDVASAIAFLCSEEARFITGANLVIDGGLTCQELVAYSRQNRPTPGNGRKGKHGRKS